MTREELKAHCEKQIEMCEMWAISKGEKPSGKIYEEHKLILELLDQQPYEDAISRQAVIDALCDECELYKNGEQTCLTKCEEYHFLATLPSVIRKFECDDAISREAVLNLCTNDKYNIPYEYEDDKGIHRGYDEYRLINYYKLKQLPSVTPKQKYGKWILADEQNKEDVENDNYRFICSECQCYDIHAKGTIVPYCWKCGAKMHESE